MQGMSFTDCAQTYITKEQLQQVNNNFNRIYPLEFKTADQFKLKFREKMDVVEFKHSEAVVNVKRIVNTTPKNKSSIVGILKKKNEK